MSPKEGSSKRKVAGRKTLHTIRACLYILMIISIICGAVAGYLFSSGTVAPLVGATGLLLLLPSALTLCYAVLHTIAGRWRKEFQFSQKKPKRTGLQSACFIIARFVTALWLTTAVAEIIVAATMPMCLAAKSNRNFWAAGKACALHRLVVIGSGIAFLISSALLCALEVSERPFDAHFFGLTGPRRPKYDPSTGPMLSGPFTQDEIFASINAEVAKSQHESPEQQQQIHQYEYHGYQSAPVHGYPHAVQYHHGQQQVHGSPVPRLQPVMEEERDLERGLTMAGAWPEEEDDDDLEVGNASEQAPAVTLPPHVHFQQPAKQSHPQRQGSTSQRTPSWGSAWTGVIGKPSRSQTPHTRILLPQKPPAAHASPHATKYIYEYTTANATTQTDTPPEPRPASRARAAGDSPVKYVYASKASPTSSSTYSLSSNSSSSSATFATSLSTAETPSSKGTLATDITTACAACACSKCTAYIAAATTRAPSAAGTVVSAATGTTLTNNGNGSTTNVTGSTAVSSSSSSSSSNSSSPLNEHNAATTNPSSIASDDMMKPQYVSTSVQARLPTPSPHPPTSASFVSDPLQDTRHHHQHQEQYQQCAQQHLYQYNQYRQHQQESYARQYLAAIQHPYASMAPSAPRSPSPTPPATPIIVVPPPRKLNILNHPLPPTPPTRCSSTPLVVAEDYSESPLPAALAVGGSSTVYRSASGPVSNHTRATHNESHHRKPVPLQNPVAVPVPVPVPVPVVLPSTPPPLHTAASEAPAAAAPGHTHNGRVVVGGPRPLATTSTSPVGHVRRDKRFRRPRSVRALSRTPSPRRRRSRDGKVSTAVGPVFSGPRPGPPSGAVNAGHVTASLSPVPLTIHKLRTSPGPRPMPYKNVKSRLGHLHPHIHMHHHHPHLHMHHHRQEQKQHDRQQQRYKRYSAGAGLAAGAIAGGGAGAGPGIPSTGGARHVATVAGAGGFEGISSAQLNALGISIV
ncbi:hypothetical protein L228DRAFT_270348 [Xylona heveae TC161]|uniref:Uncharacterized protein n=1 Tax=Xylona heveae (strain CBS 132557 / TC161) TaxID=1328760 RepID=A0A165ACQ5_XYLHT|nr:hypothetical protein L228DRAFT_270348 [Xylona heveae TC161]KZF20261.1 hypothetical protein L228DRAFT_270348 [Xylona heveae TC161]